MQTVRCTSYNKDYFSYSLLGGPLGGGNGEVLVRGTENGQAGNLKTVNTNGTEMNSRITKCRLFEKTNVQLYITVYNVQCTN